MTFNSIPFFIFFSIVFIVYYFPLKENTKAQNWLLLLSSYFFYGFADLKIVPILFVATVIVFFLGNAIENFKNSKKAMVLANIGVLSCVGLLIYFKYFNFFIDSFSAALNSIGLSSNLGTFNIIMPLGISFFTFKLISYIIEIKREKIESCKDFVSFSTYISFFPTILSGPIDRPNAFIPQLQKKRNFDYELVTDGCRQILWGLLIKLVIADKLAEGINSVWSDIQTQSSTVLIVTSILYSIQLYMDFSGYSHMAIGVGKILGFRITKNFNYPYFSRNIGEFWRNWHISLTSWLTDYVFMPLNIKLRNNGKFGMILAIGINMLLVGLWHGPNWTFIVFGLFHGLLYIPLILSGSFFKTKKLKTNKYDLPSIKDFSKMVFTFVLVTMSFVVFRAENIGQVTQYFYGISNLSVPSVSDFNAFELSSLIPVLFLILCIFLAEWFHRTSEYPLAVLGTKWKRPFRYLLYYVIILLIFLLSGNQDQFIYFQF